MRLASNCLLPTAPPQPPHPTPTLTPTPPPAEKEASEAWHHLQHMLNKEAALVAAEKGKGRAEDGGPAPPAQVPPGSNGLRAGRVHGLLI